jgi:hypothetical protein
VFEFALKASHETDGSRWSYSRELGNSRLVVIDSRAGRVLNDGRRSMLDSGEWEWLERHLTGGVDHLLIATSVPLLLAPGLHWLEAWNEAVCAGAWGKRFASVGEHLRQWLDLEHWAAFEGSFTRLVELIRAVAAGERGSAPASVGVLSGDVHHAYLAETAFSKRSGVQSIVYQAVCSPFRHPLATHERLAVQAGMSRPAAAITRALARSAGVKDPALRWRLDRPTFDNQIATLALAGREARASQSSAPTVTGATRCSRQCSTEHWREFKRPRPEPIAGIIRNLARAYRLGMTTPVQRANWLLASAPRPKSLKDMPALHSSMTTAAPATDRQQRHRSKSSLGRQPGLIPRQRDPHRQAFACLVSGQDEHVPIESAKRRDWRDECFDV